MISVSTLECIAFWMVKSIAAVTSHVGIIAFLLLVFVNLTVEFISYNDRRMA
jgi:hypothetical protein